MSIWFWLIKNGGAGVKKSTTNEKLKKKTKKKYCFESSLKVYVKVSVYF